MEIIEFSRLPDLEEKITVEVLDLYREKSFNALFKKLYTDKEEIKEKTERMYEFYSQEKQDEYGVLGIKIKVDTEN